MVNVLELLDSIRIASPCSAKWEEMTGDEHSRYCGHCDKHVYNLSALSAEAAAQLIREKEGNLCGRFYRRADGTILTADCPVGAHHRIQRKRRLAVLAGSLAGLLSFGGCTKFDDSSSTANPPAQQELKPKPSSREAAPMLKDCLGKIDLRDLRGSPDAAPAAEPEELPPPREVL